MTEASYQPEAITDYLLGSLPPSEVERLDELSVTDASFAQALQVAEADLVDAYVLDELNANQRERFERFYLRSSRSRYNTAFAQALQLMGQEQRVLSSSAERAQADAKEGGWLSRFKTYLGPGNALQWGFAIVALALLLAGLWLVLQNMRLRNQIEATQRQTTELAQRQQQLEQQLAQARADASPQQVPSPGEVGQTPTPDRSQTPSASVLSLVLTPTLRSTQRPPTVQIKPDTTAIAVTLMLEPNPFSTYRVSLIDSDGRQVWRSTPLKAKAARGGKSININLPANLLTQSSYTFRVSATGAGEAEIVGDYPIRVTK